MDIENKQDGAEPTPASAGSVDGDPRKYPASTPQVPLVPAAMYHALVVAHAEIARLRLTDAEREAVEWCIFQQATPQRIAVTLRGLLERTETVEK